MEIFWLVLIGVLVRVLAQLFHDSLAGLTDWLLRRHASRLSPEDSDRWLEEWRADAFEEWRADTRKRPSEISSLRFAMGLYKAVREICGLPSLWQRAMNLWRRMWRYTRSIVGQVRYRIGEGSAGWFGGRLGFLFGLSALILWVGTLLLFLPKDRVKALPNGYKVYLSPSDTPKPLRRSESERGEAKSLRVPERVHHLFLSLALADANDFDSYRVDIVQSSLAGQPIVMRLENLVKMPEGDISFGVPIDLVPVGYYELRLFGIDSGSQKLLEEYSIRRLK